MRIVIATRGTVGLAEGIIDDACLVMNSFCLISVAFLIAIIIKMTKDNLYKYVFIVIITDTYIEVNFCMFHSLDSPQCFHSLIISEFIRRLGQCGCCS